MAQNSIIIDKCQELLDKINEKIESNSLDLNPSSLDLGKNEDNLKQSSNGNDQLEINEDDWNFCTETKLNDIVIIQSFYGNDLRRIKASTVAIVNLLKSKTKPAEWIFIEAQKSKSQCVFSWLRAYGIKYIFQKITDEQNDLFLKTPLWNIGIKQSTSEKLCFIDSDVMFANDNWLDKINEAFSTYDVISLSKYVKYGSTNKEMPSIGYQISINRQSLGHMGLTFGAKRHILDIMENFDCVPILDDIWNWSKILGTTTTKSKQKWRICELPEKFMHGIHCNVGYADNTCIHVEHGSRMRRKYAAITDIAMNQVKSLNDLITYDPLNPQILPKQNRSTLIGQAIFNTLSKITDDRDDEHNKQVFFDEQVNVFGAIDSEHPLIVCTTFIPAFDYKLADFIQFKENISKMLSQCFEFVCFTNEDLSKYAIDTIPLSKQYFNTRECIDECFRKDVVFPKNSSILFINQYADISNQTMLLPQADFAIKSIDRDNDIKYFKKIETNEIQQILHLNDENQQLDSKIETQNKRSRPKRKQKQKRNKNNRK